MFYSALVQGVAVNLQPGSNSFFVCVCVCAFFYTQSTGAVISGKKIGTPKLTSFDGSVFVFPCFDLTRTRKVIWI